MALLKLRALLGTLFLALMAFPPVYLVAKYLCWCAKEDKLEHESKEAGSQEA